MQLPILKKEHSFFKNSEVDLCPRSLLEEEVRWHYSNHYLSECRGEEVIENLLQIATNKKQRALLGSQLNDEREHAKLFKSITNKIGLDPRARNYSDGYSKLVFSQNSLSEKVYVFQIITEAASAAYCDWRLQAICNSPFSDIDSLVQFDESRHLTMGKTMLSICDQDELRKHLTKERRIELLRQMNEVCKSSGQQGAVDAILASSADLSKIPRANLLDKLVTRSVFKEAKEVEKLLATSLEVVSF